MKRSISGAILAGGANQRFEGKTKANIVIGGKTILSHILEVAGSLFDEIIIVTNTPDEFGTYRNYIITGDVFLNAGPLGGIHAAMKASSKESVFVFACDMPFLSKEMISDQKKEYEKLDCKLLIPRILNYIEPLHSIYCNTLVTSIEDFLRKGEGYGVKDFIREMDPAYFNLSDTNENRRVFTNINTPQELEILN